MTYPLKALLFFPFTFAFAGIFSQSDSTKKIIVTILHGSKPKRHVNEVQFLGRMYGGHVVIQIDSFDYGFNFTGNRVHPYPYKRHPKGIYERDPVSLINSNWSACKVTRIEIPLNKSEFDELKNEYENFYLNSPHDYAFFGMRCAASARWMLGKCGVMKKCNRRKSIVRAFHPKALRKKLVRIARKKGYTIIVQKGRDTRKWEGD